MIFFLIIEFSKDKRYSSDLIHKFNAIATYNEKKNIYQDQTHLKLTHKSNLYIYY